MLTALDLAGIPLHAADRDDDHPIVIAGGHAAFNPEPIADFIDAAVLGDGEQAVLTITDVVREWKGEGRPGGRDELLLRLAAHRRRVRAALLRRRPTCRTAGSSGSPRTAPACPWRVGKHTVMDLDAVAVPEEAARPARRDRARADVSVEIFRGCTRGCRFCQAGMITRPVRERSIDRRSARWSRAGCAATGFEEVGLLSLSSADHSEIADDRQGARRPVRGHQRPVCRCRRTRVDAFNIDLANELSRNGRRSGLTFAPEGGCERMRKVINKMVTEEDLIRTVTTAYANGWRQVKLYFMCGLPTETDEDVLADRRAGARRSSRRAARPPGPRTSAARCRIGGFVPKPHTPFQWAAQLRPRDRRRAAGASCATRSARTSSTARRSASATTTASPAIVEGLLSPRRPPRRRRDPSRCGEAGGRFDGWSEHFSLRALDGRRRDALADRPVDVDWYTTRERDARTRCCPGTTSTPASTRTGSGRTGRTRSTRSRSRTAAGRRASTAASADHGHGDPDRPDRGDAAAADRR